MDTSEDFRSEESNTSEDFRSEKIGTTATLDVKKQAPCPTISI